MCGFCGIARPGGAPVEGDAERVAAMMAALSHRGPDEDGIAERGPVTLGHKRLSIVDLAHGQQPMTNEDGAVWIAFNGEIYNHADFRAELSAKGHVYRTRCDTEALLHLYEEEGERCVERLHGMFAFAIRDERRGRLLLARDRTGIKPLYYATLADGTLLFASEAKALFASGLLEPRLAHDAVAEYFATGHVSGARTLLEGVRKLEAGHTATWEGGTLRTRRYWVPGDRVPGASTAPIPSDLQGAADDFWREFTGAVQSQLMSDVPLGVFLSGGLDSSLITAAVVESGIRDLQTFSVGYREESASELRHAAAVAQAFGTRHHEVIVSGRDFFEQLPLLTWHRDFPLTFSASIPLYFVSRLAREQVTVVLTGEGSDELFAGYGRYPRGLWNYRIARALDGMMPGPLRRAGRNLASRGGAGYVASRVRRSFLARAGTVEDAYLEAFADFDRGHRSRLIRASGASGAGAYGDLDRLVDAELLRANPLEALLRYDQATYMEELLMKQDAMSMATSLESRVPFLHDTMLDWAGRLAPGLKLDGRTGKAVVRAAAARRLPAAATTGPKRGFLVPLGEWLRGVGRDMVESSFPEEGDDVLDARYARSLVAEHMSGHDHTARLWRILAFQVWRRETLPALAALGRRAVTEPTAAQCLRA
ncbi:MAG TPA: asparagine synthase (glutamine-hydrolyzing) [Gemmatimonadaceae bacterium]|nr:asparagine synthase (glutamine-hydrolyzing) [Gemmatimonadaceae bacterium]